MTIPAPPRPDARTAPLIPDPANPATPSPRCSVTEAFLIVSTEDVRLQKYLAGAAEARRGAREPPGAVAGGRRRVLRRLHGPARRQHRHDHVPGHGARLRCPGRRGPMGVPGLPAGPGRPPRP